MARARAACYTSPRMDSADTAREAARRSWTAEDLVERCSAQVYRLALSLCGDPREAEDLAQDALLKAIEALPSFRGEADPSTWLHRITHNAWKNRLRSKSRRPWWRLWDGGNDPDEDAGPPEPVSPEPPLEAGLEGAERDREMQKALGELSAEERAILTLREVEGRTYEEIAAALGLPQGTVKSRLNRAREALRRRMEPYLHGP